MRYQDGLTVIEALIVLAIVGVLLALGLPALSDLVEDQQLISDSNDLFASLFTARSEAVTRNEVVSMCKIATATPAAAAKRSRRLIPLERGVVMLNMSLMLLRVRLPDLLVIRVVPATIAFQRCEQLDNQYSNSWVASTRISR